MKKSSPKIGRKGREEKEEERGSAKEERRRNETENAATENLQNRSAS